MNFLIVGYKGKLGSAIFQIAKTKHNVVGVDKEENLFEFDKQNFDAIIDVSTSQNSLKTLEFARKKQIPLVIGCTGHTSFEIQEIEKAKDEIAIMRCSNFSVGITALNLALKQILKANFSDAYVTEIHHKAKKDIPSGTAKKFEEIISKTNTKLHKTTSIRQNEIIGKHKIELYLKNEHITLYHTAESRKCFAEGAIFALENISRKKVGLYDMEDFLF